MNAMILKLDLASRPIRWVSRYEGALLYCRDQVAWEAGKEIVRLYGGTNRLSGRRSFLDVNSIVAVRSVDPTGIDARVPSLTNRGLFRRDDFMCLYCGEQFTPRLLTRDHIRPLSRGGVDRWENAVTACRSCNQRKDDRLPQEIGWKLLALPYAPNAAEGLILHNRKILEDQIAFLRGRVGQESRWRAA